MWREFHYKWYLSSDELICTCPHNLTDADELAIEWCWACGGGGMMSVPAMTPCGGGGGGGGGGGAGWPLMWEPPGGCIPGDMDTPDGSRPIPLGAWPGIPICDGWGPYMRCWEAAIWGWWCTIDALLITPDDGVDEGVQSRRVEESELLSTERKNIYFNQRSWATFIITLSNK